MEKVAVGAASGVSIGLISKRSQSQLYLINYFLSSTHMLFILQSFSTSHTNRQHNRR